MTQQDCEAAINQILAEAGLRSHPFFAPPPGAGAPSPEAAWQIARAWGEITKAFMFTTIASLGVLAAEMDTAPAPAERQQLLTATTEYATSRARALDSLTAVPAHSTR
jgi:hypothetical protein